MPTYKLTYFNARGYGEVARLLLTASGTEFEDVRLEREQWPAMKDSTPQGKLPLLEVDGKKKIPQSGAIVRYLARELGMYGSNNDEMTSVDVILGSIDDLWQPFREFVYEKDETKKAEAKKKMEDEVIPAFLKYMDKVLADNGGEFFVGSKLSLADLAFYAATDQFILTTLFPESVNAYPKLVSHREKIAATPKVKAHLEKRPKTEF